MQKLNFTVDDICTKSFSVNFKGYSCAEVDSYLDLIVDDYLTMEENVKELEETIASLKEEINKLNSKKVELEGKARAYDLSNTTTYSSVDLLKRISRLEEIIYNK